MSIKSEIERIRSAVSDQERLVGRIQEELAKKINASQVKTCTLTVASDGNGIVTAICVTRFENGAFIADNRYTPNSIVPQTFSNVVCGSAIYIEICNFESASFETSGISGNPISNGYFGQVTAQAGDGCQIRAYDPNKQDQAGVIQNENTLIVNSGVTSSQDGSTLLIL